MTSNISTHAPLRRAMPGLPPCFTRRKFQLALPLRGATQVYGRHFGVYRISIRAPLVLLPGSDFNPRSPCGERQPPPMQAFTSCLFQLALPLRGATHHIWLPRIGACISIRAPLAGSDSVLRVERIGVEISIRAPLAGSDSCASLEFANSGISIRAPLAGSDSARRCA